MRFRCTQQSCVSTVSASPAAYRMCVLSVAATPSSVWKECWAVLSFLLPSRARKSSNSALLDVEIAISLKRIEPRHLNAAVEGISNLIVQAHGQAGFHISVEPVAGHGISDALRVA